MVAAVLPASIATTNGRLIPLEELELLDDALELLDDELLELDDDVLDDELLDVDELLEEDELLDELEDPVPLQPTSDRVVKQAKSQPLGQPFIFIFFIDAFQIDSYMLMVLQIHACHATLFCPPKLCPRSYLEKINPKNLTILLIHDRLSHIGKLIYF